MVENWIKGIFKGKVNIMEYIFCLAILFICLLYITGSIEITFDIATLILLIAVLSFLCIKELNPFFHLIENNIPHFIGYNITVQIFLLLIIAIRIFKQKFSSTKEIKPIIENDPFIRYLKAWRSFNENEKRCVARLCEFPGHSARSHAKALNITPQQFYQHVSQARKKCGCPARLALASMFRPYLKYLQQCK